MVEITFYGGVNEIGGNKILFDDGSSRVFFDFGKNFEKERSYFDEPYLSPREEKHLLSLGILPNIPGLYKYDTGTLCDIDAIFLSHAHTDHTQYVGYVKDSVPIYCSDLTSKLMIARDYANPTRTKKYKVAHMTKSSTDIFKTFNVMNNGAKVTIGNIDVTLYDVDHSVPGASAFLIETNNKKIVYTGDLRGHGITNQTSQFISTVKQQNIDFLITEGTNIGSTDLDDETKVGNDVSALLTNHNKCTLVSSAMYDLYRLNTIYNATKAQNKKLVIPIKQAFIIDQISPNGTFLNLNLSAQDIKIFRKKKSTTYEYEKRVIQKYQNQVENCNSLSPVQDDLVFMVSFFDMNEMCDFQPNPGSQYIISQSEPHNEEMEIDRWKLMNWLEKYGLPAFDTHCSGHIRPNELKQLIKDINPDKIIPIHTERPKTLRNFVQDLGKQVILPEEQVPIQI